MNPLTPLSEEQNEKRFRISGRTAVVFSLDSYVNHRDQFSVYFNSGQESFLTHLLSVDRDSGELVFDCSGSAEVNGRLLRSLRNIFVAKPEGVAVQFAAGQARTVEFDGDEAFAVPLPEYIIRLQRRESFRITPSPTKPPRLSIQVPDEGSKDYPLVDLSVAGCGIVADEVPAGFCAGFPLPECRFVLPDAHGTEISFQAVVRHATEQYNRRGSRQFRIGLQFSGLDKAMEHKIQRYIVHVEHERRERAK